MHLRKSLPLLLAAAFATCGSARAENWPGWRGPRGDGTSAEKDVPVKWDGANGSGVLWKIDVPGEGHSSPIVFGNRIFLTSALADTQERVLFCLDRETGKELWRQVVVKA